MTITRLIDFPDTKASAMVIMDADGNENIYINARMSAEMQRKGFKHEMEHIKHDDLHSILPADEIEAIRHREET